MNQELSKDDRYTLERYNRECAKYRLLKEIRFTLSVCELGGWDKLEFINDLKQMINELGTENGA